MTSIEASYPSMLSAALLALAVGAGCRTDEPADNQGSGRDLTAHSNAPRTKIRHKLEALEVSGFALGPPDEGGHHSILAVSDHHYEIYKIRLSPDLTAFSNKPIDVSHLFDTNPKGSQWEGIAIDGGGRLFILEESPGRVFVLAPDEDNYRLLQTIELYFTDEVPATWAEKSGSRGEGIILLENGHLLVLKEKNDPLLIEFSLGTPSRGVSTATLLPPDVQFKLSEGELVRYLPVKVWRIHEDTRNLMKDLSELTIAPDGWIYVLSQQGNALGRLEGELTLEQEEAAVQQAWHLPIDIEKAEALVLLPGMVPVVGTDHKKITENINVLEPLESME